MVMRLSKALSVALYWHNLRSNFTHAFMQTKAHTSIGMVMMELYNATCQKNKCHYSI